MLRALLGLKPRLSSPNDQKPYDECWDIALNAALDNFPIKAGKHTAKIGPFEVWVCNYPYAYGNRCQTGYPESGLPSLKTRARLYRMIKDASCSSYIDELEYYKNNGL